MAFFIVTAVKTSDPTKGTNPNIDAIKYIQTW
jgi:hypothetical protein